MRISYTCDLSGETLREDYRAHDPRSHFDAVPADWGRFQDVRPGLTAPVICGSHGCVRLARVSWTWKGDEATADSGLRAVDGRNYYHRGLLPVTSMRFGDVELASDDGDCFYIGAVMQQVNSFHPTGLAVLMVGSDILDGPSPVIVPKKYCGDWLSATKDGRLLHVGVSAEMVRPLPRHLEAA